MVFVYFRFEASCMEKYPQQSTNSHPMFRFAFHCDGQSALRMSTFRGEEERKTQEGKPNYLILLNFLLPLIFVS